jgi:glutathione S-transferase
MITLYGVYRSRASRPLWLLHETGQPFHHIPVIQAYRLSDPAAPDAPFNTASPAYLAINPIGQIPCLTDGPLTLTESMAIVLYIARQSGTDCAPKDEAEAAVMTNWSFFAATGIEEPALRIMLTLNGDRAATPEGKAMVAAAAESLRRPLARLEAHLAAHPWLVAGRFTAADINVAECVRYATAHPTLLTEFPAVRGWLAKLHDRPAFKAMWARRLMEPA